MFRENRWLVINARLNIRRSCRVLIARGRDAADMSFLRSFGEHEPVGFAVTTKFAAATPLQACADGAEPLSSEPLHWLLGLRRVAQLLVAALHACLAVICAEGLSSPPPAGAAEPQALSSGPAAPTWR